MYCCRNRPVWQVCSTKWNLCFVKIENFEESALQNGNCVFTNSTGFQTTQKSALQNGNVFCVFQNPEKRPSYRMAVFNFWVWTISLQNVLAICVWGRPHPFRSGNSHGDPGVVFKNSRQSIYKHVNISLLRRVFWNMIFAKRPLMICELVLTKLKGLGEHGIRFMVLKSVIDMISISCCILLILPVVLVDISIYQPTRTVVSFSFLGQSSLCHGQVHGELRQCFFRICRRGGFFLTGEQRAQAFSNGMDMNES